MRYAVLVEITQRRQKELTIYARDESEAEEKAENIVSGWNDVDDVDILDVEEME